MPSKNIQTNIIKQLIDGGNFNTSYDGYKLVAHDIVNKMHGFYSEYFFIEEATNFFYRYQGRFWYSIIGQQQSDSKDLSLIEGETTNCVQVLPVQQIINKFVDVNDAYDDVVIKEPSNNLVVTKQE